MLKIAIFNSRGKNVLPESISEQIDGLKFLEGRIKLADILEKLECTHDKMSYEALDEYTRTTPDSHNRRDYMKFKGDNTIRVKDYSEDYGDVSIVSICQVDTSKNWTVKVVDGAESIYYPPEYVVVDKEANYVVLKGQEVKNLDIAKEISKTMTEFKSNK